MQVGLWMEFFGQQHRKCPLVIFLMMPWIQTVNLSAEGNPGW